MTEFEKVLQESLLALEHGDSNVEECLSLHPKHALQLEPILVTSLDLERGRQMRPSAAFKARVRAKLTQEMRAHPRKTVRFNFMFTRIATSFAAIVLALLVAGTVYAQSALPGNAFYTWKLTSENIWRVLSPDPIGTDLAMATRRANELLAIGNNPLQRTQVLKTYMEVVTRLKSEMDPDNEARIESVLNSQIEQLNKSGIPVPSLDQDVRPPLDQPTIIPTNIPQLTPGLPIPTASPVLMQETAQVNPTLPIPTATSVVIQEATQVSPTDSPKIVPTVQVSTIQVPTLPIPSLIP